MNVQLIYTTGIVFLTVGVTLMVIVLILEYLNLKNNGYIEVRQCHVCGKRRRCVNVLGRLYCECCNEDGCKMNLRTIKNLKRELKKR